MSKVCRSTVMQPVFIFFIIWAVMRLEKESVNINPTEITPIHQLPSSFYLKLPNVIPPPMFHENLLLQWRLIFGSDRCLEGSNVQQWRGISLDRIYLGCLNQFFYFFIKTLSCQQHTLVEARIP